MQRKRRAVLYAGVWFALAAGLPGVAHAEAGVEELQLTVGKSAVIDYPADVARISTSNPEIVDAVAISKREILLNAKSFGASSVVVWSRSGGRTFFAVTV